MVKIGYTRKPDGQNRVPPSTLVPRRQLIGQRPPRPDSGRFETGPPNRGYSSPHRLPDFNHTYPIMAGLLDQQPTRARVIASSRDAAGHLCGRRGRACSRILTSLCSLYVMGLSLINTSYQKLPFGSGDYSDKLLFHQALN